MLATYICATCGEENETIVDESQGIDQEYIEDCQVCCRPNALSVHLTEEGALIEAEFEE
jgi:hypothetical protein